MSPILLTYAKMHNAYQQLDKQECMYEAENQLLYQVIKYIVNSTKTLHFTHIYFNAFYDSQHKDLLCTISRHRINGQEFLVEADCDYWKTVTGILFKKYQSNNLQAASTVHFLFLTMIFRLSRNSKLWNLKV
jgi:hypothetical protein